LQPGKREKIVFWSDCSGKTFLSHTHGIERVKQSQCTVSVYCGLARRDLSSSHKGMVRASSLLVLLFVHVTGFNNAHGIERVKQSQCTCIEVWLDESTFHPHTKAW
jgi:hypothetical protein